MCPVPVVLLHGLGRTARSLRHLARALDAEGHPSLVLDYPSRSHDVRACAAYLSSTVIKFQRRHGGDVAFVGHSMGGLVARVLATDPGVRTRAIVMLAPPNGGSEVADFVHRFALGRLVLGPALSDLRTTSAESIPTPACCIGVIAGALSYLPFTGRLIAGRNDGLVSLERTRLRGAEWMAVDAGHTLLMDHPETAPAVTAFLTRGRFPACPDGKHRNDGSVEIRK